MTSTTQEQASQTWRAWLDGKRDDAVEFQVPQADIIVDIAELGANALGVNVCGALNVQIVID